jgi:hypothetical protein
MRAHVYGDTTGLRGDGEEVVKGVGAGDGVGGGAEDGAAGGRGLGG